MDTLECINTRRSVRSFLDKPVEFDKVSMILEAGHAAPSAGNLQDWKFILVTDTAIIKLISEHCTGQYWAGEAPVMIIVCANVERQETYYGLRGKRFYNIQDAAAAAQNILLAAHTLELGACWIGAFDEIKVSDILSIPRDARPVAIIPLGYTMDVPKAPIKVPLKDAVYFNRFGNKIEFIHRVLKDWSIEWDRAINETSMPFIQRSIRRINDRMKSLSERMKEQARKQKEFRAQKRDAKMEQQRVHPKR